MWRMLRPRRATFAISNSSFTRCKRPPRMTGEIFECSSVALIRLAGVTDINNGAEQWK
jgi:hypothetical protein